MNIKFLIDALILLHPSLSFVEDLYFAGYVCSVRVGRRAALLNQKSSMTAFAVNPRSVNDDNAKIPKRVGIWLTVACTKLCATLNPVYVHASPTVVLSFAPNIASVRAVA